MDTDDNHRAVAQDFWFNYRFNDLVDLHVGKAFVPGSREWLDGALKMRLGDRSLVGICTLVANNGRPIDRGGNVPGC